jgi:hypothetical protein
MARSGDVDRGAVDGLALECGATLPRSALVVDGGARLYALACGEEDEEKEWPHGHLSLHFPKQL